jgi:hypothetical protein
MPLFATAPTRVAAPNVPNRRMLLVRHASNSWICHNLAPSRFGPQVFRVEPQVGPPLPVHVRVALPTVAPGNANSEAAQAYGAGARDVLHEVSRVDDGADLAGILRGAGRDLVLYRAFAASHFCWPQLRASGALVSEGSNDIPTYTMFGEKTSWLPFAPGDHHDVAAIAAGSTDEATRALSLKHPVMLGVVVSYTCDERRLDNRAAAICWLNGGETAVRGPLLKGEFEFSHVMWMHNRMLSTKPWPRLPANTKLFPERPFGPAATDASIAAWWRSCKDWVLTAASAGDEMAIRVLAHDALASASQLRR